MAAHGVVERGAALGSARLAQRADEQTDPAVAVRDHVVDEQLDAGPVVEQHGAGAAAGDHAVEEHARRAPARDEAVEVLPPDPDRRDEQPVDTVGDQRPQRLDLAVGGLLGVHQQHAVSGLLERSLRALERRRVERTRDVGHHEAHRVGRAGTQRAGELGRLEVELARDLDHGGTCLGRQLAASGQRPRRRRRRDPGDLGDVGERDLTTSPQTVAQAIATLS